MSFAGSHQQVKAAPCVHRITLLHVFSNNMCYKVFLSIIRHLKLKCKKINKINKFKDARAAYPLHVLEPL